MKAAAAIEFTEYEVDPIRRTVPSALLFAAEPELLPPDGV
jgi:hypothetical protein